MYFNTDLPFHLLFQAWYINTVGSKDFRCLTVILSIELVGACFGVFLLAILYEGIKVTFIIAWQSFSSFI